MSPPALVRGCRRDADRCRGARENRNLRRCIDAWGKAVESAGQLVAADNGVADDAEGLRLRPRRRHATGVRNRCGVIPTPTPPGVPVAITSPGQPHHGAGDCRR